ncbi:hypothetical protein [Ornithinimicrobium kibberense]|uniref:hypothetical protein n=1 Tax=Ornithinimicrobium kibberense TaxID=282060 RepID=UPI00360DAEE1
MPPSPLGRRQEPAEPVPAQVGHGLRERPQPPGHRVDAHARASVRTSAAAASGSVSPAP